MRLIATRRRRWIVAVAVLAVLVAVAAGGYLQLSRPSPDGPCALPRATGKTIWTAPRACHTVTVTGTTGYPNVVVFVGQTIRVESGNVKLSSDFAPTLEPDSALTGEGRTYVARAPGIDQIEANGPPRTPGDPEHGPAYTVGVDVQVSGVSLTSPTFTSPLVGWALDAGHLAKDEDANAFPNHVERSGDGGRTWHDVTPPGGSLFVDSLAPVSDSVAWAVWEVAGTRGSEGPPLHLGVTSDGGASWVEHSLPDQLANVESVQATDALHAVVVFSFGRFTNGPINAKGEPSTIAPVVATTSDGGATWKETPLWFDETFDGVSSLAVRGSSALLSLVFTNPNQGQVVVARTGNGGETWDSVAAPGATEPDCQIPALVLPTTSQGFLVTACPSPTLWSTDDGGANWSSLGPLKWLPQASPTSVGRYLSRTNLVFLDGRHGWTFQWPDGPGGKAELFATPDGGHSWHPSGLQLPTSAGSAWISFPTAQVGLVWVASEGRFYKTDDGGATWTRLPVPTSA